MKAVERGILRANEFTLLPSTAMRERMFSPPADAEAALLRAIAVNEGAARDALARFNHTTALRECLQAQQQLAALSSRPAWRGRVVELLVLEARIHLSAGQAEAAQASLRTARRVSPSLLLDPARYAPEVMEAFGAAAPTARASPFTVRVDGDRARLATFAPRIWIDGELLEPSQATLWVATSALGEGPHFVRIEAFGHVPTSERIVMQPGAPGELFAQLAPLPAGEMIAAWREELGTAEAIADLQRASLQLAAQVAGDALITFRRGPLGEPQTVVWPGEGRDATIIFGDADPEEVVRYLRKPRGLRLERPPLWRRRWVQWTAAGVAIGTVAAVLLLSQPRDSAELNPVIVLP